MQIMRKRELSILVEFLVKQAVARMQPAYHADKIIIDLIIIIGSYYR